MVRHDVALPYLLLDAPFDLSPYAYVPVSSHDYLSHPIPEGKWLFTGSEDGTIRIWDLSSQTCKRIFDAQAAVNAAVLNPNQAEIISGELFYL